MNIISYDDKAKAFICQRLAALHVMINDTKLISVFVKEAER